jgi:hypothetical protein
VRKINWKIINFAFWIEVGLSYLLPFKTIDNFQYKVGFPIPFLTIYDTKIGINPLMSMQLNPLALLINGIIIYFIISLAIKTYRKFETSHTQ